MNDLIFGKDKRENIVAIEVEDEHVEIFYETDKIENEWIGHKYWLLSNRAIDNSWIALKGNLHYSWAKKYVDFTDFIKAKSYLKKREDIYSVGFPQEATMIVQGITYFKGMKVEDVSTLAFDIETTGLDKEKDNVLLISNTYKKKDKVIRKLFCYDNYKDPSEFIEDWCRWVKTMDPSVLLGHNIFSFDIPFLDNFAQRHGTTLNLGRNDSNVKWESWESKFRIDGSKDLHYHRCHIYGRNIIDTLFLSYKYDIGRNYDNYKLKYIIEKEDLQSKDRQFYDASQIRFKYKDKEEWEKIKQYCIHDADDALNLYFLMVPSFFYLTQSIPKTFQQIGYTATGSQLNSLLVRSYLQDGYSIPKADEIEHFQGAISFGIPNTYKNLLKIDFSALYPNIIRQYKIYDTKKDPKQHLLKVCDYFTIERLKNKKIAKETNSLYHKDLEQSAKIVINSIYGLMGANGLNFNFPIGASKITKIARDLMSFSIYWATSKDINYWLDLFKEKTHG